MTKAQVPAPIVVGVDGSEASNDALRWAARYTELTGASLELITVRGRQARVAGGRSDVELDEEARKLLQAVVEEVLGPSPRVSATLRVVEGPHPALVLIKASRQAALLVVGRHGHGRLAAAAKAAAAASVPAGAILLGSVSQHCVQHAACPVLVVPALRPAAGIRTPPPAAPRT